MRVLQPSQPRQRGSHPSKEPVIHGEPTSHPVSQPASQPARPEGTGQGSRAQQGIQSPRDLYNSRAKPSYPSRPSSPPPTPRAIPRVELQITNVGLSRVAPLSLSLSFWFAVSLPGRTEQRLSMSVFSSSTQ